MDSYKNFTGHRYWCILSKYRAIFPRWLELKDILMDFNCCLLLLAQIQSPSLAMWESRHVTDDVIAVSIYSNRKLDKKAKMASPTSKIKTLITRLSVNILRCPFSNKYIILGYILTPSISPQLPLEIGKLNRPWSTCPCPNMSTMRKHDTW